MSGAEAAALRQMILDCAVSHEMPLDAIYVDELDTAPAQLTECIAAVVAADESILIVPSLIHFAGLGNPVEVRADFERHGVTTLIAQQ